MSITLTLTRIGELTGGSSSVSFRMPRPTLVAIAWSWEVHFPRPFVNNDVNLLYEHSLSTSFPSDHSLGSMSIALGLNVGIGVLSKINMFLAVFVGFTRVYVGHHYPLDVIGGFILAYIICVVYNKYSYKFVSDISMKVESVMPILKRL